MRRIACDDPFDGGDEPPRRSRVVRLIDLTDEGGSEPCRDHLEKRPSRSTAPESVGGEACRKVKNPRPAVGAESREKPHIPAAVPTVLSVTPEGEGETIAVTMVLPTDGEEQKPRRIKLHLLVEQYANLRADGVSLDCGDISEEHAALLIEAGELCEAIRRGMAALQYGDRSAHRLATSLGAKGIPRETAEAAAAYLARKGYIREEETARRRVGSDLRKGWGPRRIREDLRALGLESEAVDMAMEELSEVDFDELCAEVIRKKYGDLPAERGERQKMTAALMRLGYDADHIRGAMRLLTRGAS